MFEFFKFLEAQMETPGNYGWFHLMFIGIMITLVILLIVFFRNASDKVFRIIIGVSWGIMVLGEIYKQLTFTFGATGTEWSIDYQWYAFPFQFCSTPLYVLPFVAFLKDGKIRKACMSFSSFFAIFGGLAVFVFPNDVFTSQIGINIQTMTHHGLQFVTAIFISVWNRRNFNVKYWLAGIPVFAVVISVACAINGIAFVSYTNGYEDIKNVNMFYIRHDLDNHLPILGDVQAALKANAPAIAPYAFFLVYCLGFILVSAIMWGLQIGVYWLVISVIALVKLVLKTIKKEADEDLKDEKESN